jgi:hypothetical protein
MIRTFEIDREWQAACTLAHSPLGRRGIFEIHQKPADTVSGAYLQHARFSSCRSWPPYSQLQMPALSHPGPGPDAHPKMFSKNEAHRVELKKESLKESLIVTGEALLL